MKGLGRLRVELERALPAWHGAADKLPIAESNERMRGTIDRMRMSVLVVAALTLSSCSSRPASSGSGSGSATAATAGSGSASAATLDPKFAGLDAQERHTCGIYARCKVEGLRDDDPQAESKEPTFENACLAVWVTLPAAAKQTIASCADKVGQCLGPPPCFDSMKL